MHRAMVCHLSSLRSTVHSSRDVRIVFCVVQDAPLFEDVQGVLYMVYSV